MAKERNKAVRAAVVERKTRETSIRVSLVLDGSGKARINTGIGFFDHMLEVFAKRALFDLDVKAKGDLHVDMHHTVEDVGIVLGQALKQALGDKKGIWRYASIGLPMDESLVQAAVDISGRPFLFSRLKFKLKLKNKKVGDFDTSLVKEFLQALVNNALITLHIVKVHGDNDHHIIEAVYKGLGLILGQACRIDPRQKGVPSTKGVL